MSDNQPQTQTRLETVTHDPDEPHNSNPYTAHADEHNLNDNWEWSDSFTQFINSRVTGFSLMVCPGRRPICDVNLGISDLRAVSESDSTAFTVAELHDTTESDTRLERIYTALQDAVSQADVYGRVTSETATNGHQSCYDGYTVAGDMFELPFESGTFETVVADPPWLELPSAECRQELFAEIVRVTAPTGQILYNATWIPDHEQTRQYDLRMRQQKDFWGGPSFASCYRQIPQTTAELFEAHDYDSLDRYPDSAFWDEDFRPDALSEAHGTDAKLISPRMDDYCCPQCGHPRLCQIRDPHFESPTGEYDLYECLSCEFRVPKDNID